MKDIFCDKKNKSKKMKGKIKMKWINRKCSDFYNLESADTQRINKIFSSSRGLEFQRVFSTEEMNKSDVFNLTNLS